MAEAIKDQTARSARPKDKHIKLKNRPHSPLGVTPSSAFLNRFLRGRKPGTGMILDLPTEVLETIAGFLPLDAFGSFRLTCRDVDHRTLRIFGNNFFTSKNFLPSRYGLQALVVISQSRVAQYVRAVGLGPPSQDRGEPFIWHEKNLSSAQKDQIFARMYEYAEDNHLMRSLGEDAAMIGSALRNMPSITALKFLDTGSNQYCPSFGASYFKEIVSDSGYFTHVNLDALQSMSRLFAITLRAAEAAGLELECVDAKITQWDGEDMDWEFFCRAYRTPLNLSSAISSHEPHPAIFSNLTKLRIPVNSVDVTFEGYRNDLQARQKRYVRDLASFLSKSPRLEHLGLFFGEDPGAHGLLMDIINTGDLARLKSFELGSLHMCPHKLINTLEPLSHLERLYFHDVWVTISHGGWHTVVDWIISNMTNLKTLDMVAEDEDHSDETHEYPFTFVDQTSNEAFKEELEQSLMVWCRVTSCGNDDSDN